MTFAKYDTKNEFWKDLEVDSNALPKDMAAFTEVGALVAFEALGVELLFDSMSKAQDNYNKLKAKLAEAEKALTKGKADIDEVAKLETKTENARNNFKAATVKYDTFVAWCNENVTADESIKASRSDTVVCIAFNPWLAKIVDLGPTTKDLYDKIMDYFRLYKESDKWTDDRKGAYEYIKSALLNQANSVRESNWNNLTSKNATLFLDSLKHGIKLGNSKSGLTIEEKRDNEVSFVATLFLWLVAVNGGYNDMKAEKVAKRKLQKITF